MSCIIPPEHPNPMLHNDVVANLQSDIDSCGWVDLIFPLADISERDVNGSRILVPVVYGQQQEGVNNYIEMFPDGKSRAGCFFELPGGFYDEDRVGETFEYEISVIVWANLNLLASRDYDFTDELMASVRQALVNGIYSNEITRVRMTKDKNQVFQKYGYSYQSLYSFMYPKTAFKITLTMEMTVDADCFSPGSFPPFTPIC